MNKSMSVTRAAAYLKEWSGFKAVKKTNEDESFYYFDGKTVLRAEGWEIRVERKVTTSNDFNIWERPAETTEEWQWCDAIPAEYDHRGF